MIALTVFVVLAVLVITNRIGGGTYVAKVLYAFDVFCCALVTRDTGLSLSGQCEVYYLKGHAPLFWRYLRTGLGLMQKDHCPLALAHDRARAQDVINRTK